MRGNNQHGLDNSVHVARTMTAMITAVMVLIVVLVMIGIKVRQRKYNSRLPRRMIRKEG